MEIFRSRDDLKAAYRSLLQYEQQLQNRLRKQEENGRDPSAQTIVDEQNRIMRKIERSEKTDPGLAEPLASWIHEIVEEFSQLRKQTLEIIQQQRSLVQSRIESLDQSLQLMRHYMQGRRRSEESKSYRMDRTV